MHMNRKRISMIRIILLSAIFAAAATGTALMKRGGDAEPTPHAHSSLARSQQGERESGQLVRVWVHGDDLYPDVVKARPGKIFFRVENQTQSDVAIVVERVMPGQASQRLSRVATTGKARRADQHMTLGEGEYVFYAESKPEYKGLLIVEARK